MELEPQTPSPPPPLPAASSLSSTVDTSRAFSSVKEAVAVLGQKILARELIRSSSPYSYQNSPVRQFSPKSNITEKNDQNSLADAVKRLEAEKNEPGDQNTLAHAVKRLEAELEATKTELKLVKKREEETEVAVASLNSELHKNMSKIARGEGGCCGKSSGGGEGGGYKREGEEDGGGVLTNSGSDFCWWWRRRLVWREKEGEREGGEEEEEDDAYCSSSVWELFSRRKESSTDDSLHSSRFSSPHLHLN